MAKSIGNFKVTDNSALVLLAEKQVVQKSLKKIGIKWEEIVVKGVPVDTGYLRNSRGHTIGDYYVILGFMAEYAAYVELGTDKMTAQPYLSPSILNHIGVYKEIFEHELKHA